MLAHSDGSEGDEMAIAVARGLVRFYQILKEEGRFLSPAASIEIAALGQQVGVLYSALSRKALEAGLHIWKLVPKMHLFVHLCEWVAPLFGNPSAYWTYADEDLVGNMIEVATSCHPTTLAFTALLKWVYAYFIE